MYERLKKSSEGFIIVTGFFDDTKDSSGDDKMNIASDKKTPRSLIYAHLVKI